MKIDEQDWFFASALVFVISGLFGTVLLLFGSSWGASFIGIGFGLVSITMALLVLIGNLLGLFSGRLFDFGVYQVEVAPKS
jgi:hypothetical protein